MSAKITHFYITVHCYSFRVICVDFIYIYAFIVLDIRTAHAFYPKHFHSVFLCSVYMLLHFI